MITKKITKPHNCLLVLCIPLSKEEFLHDLTDDNKDFAKTMQRKYNLSTSALWEIDYEPLADMIKGVIKDVEKVGVKVITGFSSHDFHQISNDYDVTTMVAHWLNSTKKIELFDGFMAPEDYEKNIPMDYVGVIDLTVCNSVNLQKEIKSKRNNIVLANEHSTSLEYRMTQYKYCIKLLNEKNYNYIDAITELRIKILAFL